MDLAKEIFDLAVGINRVRELEFRGGSGNCSCPNCGEDIETEDLGDNPMSLTGECACGTVVEGNELAGYEEI